MEEIETGNEYIEAEKMSDELTDFYNEVIRKDHTDYETDWSEYDEADAKGEIKTDENDFSKSSEIEDEINRIQKKIKQKDNHHVRMVRKIKKEMRKDRNSRLIMWGAEFEYWLVKICPSLKKVLPYIDREMQKKIVWRIFADLVIRNLIVRVMQEYTKDMDEDFLDKYL